MEGIVIFRSGITGAVVVWCSDQGPLAVLGPGVMRAQETPVVGDLLSVTVEELGTVRVCTDYTIQRRLSPKVQDMLLSQGAELPDREPLPGAECAGAADREFSSAPGRD